ncbi:MAG: V-type ATP synthase subunit I [Spirochaetales bacterium]|nr:V-type ATP synthase subunit I [Spirochaetales bacterium]
MIVRMKKATIIVPEEKRSETLLKLRALGIIHIGPLSDGNGSRTEDRREKLIEQRVSLEKAVRTLPLIKKKENSSVSHDYRDALRIAEKIGSLDERLIRLREERERFKSDYDLFAPWGNFNPGDIIGLREKGVDIRLYEMTHEGYGRLAAGIRHCVVRKSKEKVYFITSDSREGETIPQDDIRLPEYGPQGIESRITEVTGEIENIERELRTLARQRAYIEYAIEKISHEIEFETIRLGMGEAGELCYLTGFSPLNTIDLLKKKASVEGWGLLIDEPAADDEVPTLIETPKWVKIIDPVFKLLGTVPGYREYDISVWFLLFFSIFFAMIIGDAGYGCIILLTMLIARLAVKKMPKHITILIVLLSCTTIVWGAITGTWFGSEAIAESVPFSWFIVPLIASFPGSDNPYNTQDILMFICFTLAAIQLTIAHLISFLKKVPALQSYADLGKISMLWGLYFLILSIVLKHDLPSFAVISIASGFIVNFICVEQKGNFLKGLLSSLKNIIPITLNSIGSFSDIISYVRLFAVGLAAVKVAEAFNNIAGGIGLTSIWAVIGTLLIIVVGHGFNIVMSGMSVIVHGIRLNMLEFSGHLGMEWSGREYKPFREFDEIIEENEKGG